MKQTTQSPRWFFWFVAVFTLPQLVWFVLLAFDFVTHPLAPESTYGLAIVRLVTTLGIVPFAFVVSILVLRRAPGNVCGLFLLQWTILIMGETLRPDSPLIPYYLFGMGWLGIWLLPLYFPNGRAFPQRFEVLIYVLSAACIFANQSGVFIKPNLPVWALGGASPNPLFVPAFANFQAFINQLENLTLIFIILLVIPSVFLRLRNSITIIRKQIRRLAQFAGVFVVASVLLGLSGISSRPVTRLNTVELGLKLCWSTFFTLAPFVAVANAILRHKLYDIDIIIRRTLIYSVLTTILAVVYFGGVILTQQLFKVITGETSDLAIVISTLLIAALFSPIRRRVQAVIDRRLYRRKYDVEQTLVQFQQNLRDEVDVETLKTHLVDVVSETMQPRSIGLWINSNSRKELNS